MTVSPGISFLPPQMPAHPVPSPQGSSQDFQKHNWGLAGAGRPQHTTPACPSCRTVQSSGERKGFLCVKMAHSGLLYTDLEISCFESEGGQYRLEVAGWEDCIRGAQERCQVTCRGGLFPFVPGAAGSRGPRKQSLREYPFCSPWLSNLLMEGSGKSISTNERELVESKFYFPKPENS